MFICNFNYARNGKTFNQHEQLPQIPSFNNQNYRNLQRDSTRCYILLLGIFLKAYLSKAVEDQKSGKFNKGKVAQYTIDKLQKLNFGISMLQNNDFHVHQIGIVLKDCLKVYKGVLDAAGITNDFQYLTEFMTTIQNRGLPIDKSKLSAAAQAVPDYNAPGIAEKSLPADFIKIIKAIDARSLEDWSKYKVFTRIFKKQSDLSTSAALAKSKLDVDMSGAAAATESPTQIKSAKAAAGETEADPLDFNLHEKYENHFAKFKKTFSDIIN